MGTESPHLCPTPNKSKKEKERMIFAFFIILLDFLQVALLQSPPDIFLPWAYEQKLIQTAKEDKDLCSQGQPSVRDSSPQSPPHPQCHVKINVLLPTCEWGGVAVTDLLRRGSPLVCTAPTQRAWVEAYTHTAPSQGPPGQAFSLSARFRAASQIIMASQRRNWVDPPLYLGAGRSHLGRNPGSV